MINDSKDIGFIHDIAGLDRLRQEAVSSNSGEQDAALKAAAKQFEALFTSMLFKSMRDANSHFESGLMDSQNQQFYRQMMDEQMASEMSASGSLGLADMIVAQLTSGRVDNTNAANRSDDFSAVMEKVNRTRRAQAEQPYYQQRINEQTGPKLYEVQNIEQVARTNGVNGVNNTDKVRFDSPQEFVRSLKPYAEKAAKLLGVDSAVLLAQAALETGWGKKIIHNSADHSNNLFNIKADKSWGGDKVAKQTLEYHQGVPVQELAAFRSYNSYQESFDDYVRFLQRNPRYHDALQHEGNSEQFIRGIHQAGYATDPNYADKVLRVRAQIEQM